MLKFNEDQLGQLRQAYMADHARFVNFVGRHVQDHCRDSVRDIDPLSLREMVENGLARARSHGLDDPKSLTAFVAIMFEIGPNFDEEPEIRAALADASVPMAERFDTLLARVSDAAWERAEAQRDSLAWFPELGDAD